MVVIKTVDGGGKKREESVYLISSSIQVGLLEIIS